MLVPKLRFKRDDGRDYPEWEEKHFSDISTAFSERNKEHLDLDVYSINNQIGFIPQEQQFKDAGYLKNTDTSIYMIVPPNHFVYNPARINVGSIGYQNLGYTVQVSSLYEVFNTTDDCNDMFIWHWFHTPLFSRMVMKYGEGGVRVYYYYDKLCETPILLPCLEEQQKIADFLSTVDEVITQSENEVQNLEQQKKAAMQKIFSQEVRFKKDDGTEYPEWEECTLGNIGEVAMCKRILKEQTSEQGDVPFFKISTFGGIPDAFISFELYKTFKNTYRFPKKGAVLISAAGTIGKTVRYNGEDAYYQDSNIVWLEHNDNVIDDFLYQFYQQATWEGLEGSTIKRLYNKNLLETAISFPCLEEQKKIADFLSTVDEAISYARQEFEHWKQLKKSLLQQMFV